MRYLTDKLHNGSIYDHVAMKHYTARVCLCLLHTVDPGNYYAFPECLPQQSHPTGRVVVKQLEDVHPSLQRSRRLSEQCGFSKTVQDEVFRSLVSSFTRYAFSFLLLRATKIIKNLNF